MLHSSGTVKILTVGWLLLLVFVVSASRSFGAGIGVIALSPGIERSDPQKLSLTAGKAILLTSTSPVSRISEPNPDIAKVLLLSPKEIYITPTNVGLTNLLIWHNSQVSVYDLEVGFDISRFKQRLNEVLPDERDLRIISTHDSITLSGRISSSNSLDQALAVAQSFAPEGKVRNMVEVAGVHQVMLEVRVAEVSKSDMKRLGFNFQFINGTEFVVSMLGGLTTLDAEGKTFLSSNVNSMFRFGDNDSSWTGFIDALKEDGVIKVLAEPTLITMSGQNASFLAGGEFPVPVPDDDGIAIEYKSYGVGLNFMPTVLSPDRINLRVTPEVSELDWSNALTYQGFVVPGLAVRRATTSVELGDGKSFAIAGLLKSNSAENVSKFPILGDLPILGMLFRSSAYQNKETELVIVVTPRLVKPSHVSKQPLPTDNYIDPGFTDLAFPELNYTSKKEGVVSTRGSLDGDFGPAAPRP
ncbi:MAG: type II and III secretion system protein family protein [Desulfatirhabdiaceae bacterium]